MAAQKVIEGMVMDDPYLYFRCWLIAQGQNVFHLVLENPDYLADIAPTDEFLHFESLLYISTEAYRQKTGKQEEDETFPRMAAHDKGFSYDFMPTQTKGKKPKEDQLSTLYPKLWAKFRK